MLGAALNEDHAAANPVEKLGELARDDAAAKDDHARRDEIEVEHFVARPAP